MDLLDFSAHVTYCEDVRSEVGGGQTYVGVMRGNVGLPNFPGVLGKLCIVIDLVADGTQPWASTSISVVKISSSGEELLVHTDFDQASLPPLELISVPNEGPELAVLNAVVALQPLPIEGPTKIRVKISRAGKNYPVPALKFIHAPETDT